MSYDRQIDQVCPHLVVDEALFVSPDDSMTIRPIAPIASIPSVQVRINGALDVPSQGAYTPAQIVGSKQGSYNVTDSTNRIVLSVNQGPDITLTAPTAKGLSPEKLVAALNTSRDVQFYVDQGKVGFRTALEGPESSVFVRSNSTLAPILGITANREYRGKRLAPGWTIVSAPNTVDVRPTRLIIFDDPLKDFNAFAEISYATLQQDCRRCQASGLEHDWRYGTSGEVIQVRDEALLLQDVMKITFTNKGSNRFHKLYGTILNEVIGKKQSVSGISQGMIVADVQRAFQNLQAIKKVQEEQVGQFLSDEEYPSRLISVTLDGVADDPTVAIVNVVIQNRSQRPIELSRGVKLPAGVNLFGDSQSGGNIRQSLRNWVLAG